MRASLAQLHSRLATTTVYVTHDQTDAMTLGQRVAVMRDGRLQQLDTPQALYRRPENVFVASFIGSPPMNLVDARLESDHVVFGNLRLPLDRDSRPAALRSDAVVLGIRPEDFRTGPAVNGLPSIDADVVVVEDLGAETHVLVALDAPRLSLDTDTREEQLLADDRAQFTARLDADADVRPGTRIRLAVDPARLHFSDPKTGSRILG